MKLKRTRPNTWKGVLDGMAGGLVASWTMNQFQALISKASEKISSNGGNGSGGHANQSSSSQNSSQNNNEDAMMPQ